MISNQKLIDDIWNYFNTQLMNVIDNNIPSKICGGRTRTPCITRDIKHMLHKKTPPISTSKENQILEKTTNNTRENAKKKK